MKIICVEEHAADAAIGKASQQALLGEAGYIKDFVAETPTDTSRPMLNSMKLAMEQSADLGRGRLSEMDEHGISMQVLSYSNSTQLAPAGQAAQLARAASSGYRSMCIRVSLSLRCSGPITADWRSPSRPLFPCLPGVGTTKPAFRSFA